MTSYSWNIYIFLCILLRFLFSRTLPTFYVFRSMCFKLLLTFCSYLFPFYCEDVTFQITYLQPNCVSTIFVYIFVYNHYYLIYSYYFCFYNKILKWWNGECFCFCCCSLYHFQLLSNPSFVYFVMLPKTKVQLLNVAPDSLKAFWPMLEEIGVDG